MGILDSFRLDGRRAVVTGGSRGLGFEIGCALAEAGAEVVLSGRDPERLAGAVARLTAEGHRAIGHPADLSDPAGAERFCNELLERTGGVDILVNNVGGRRIDTPTEDLPLEDWQRVVDLNLTQAFVCTKRIGAAMLARGRGRVINVASISGLWALRGKGGRAYEASKAGLIMFTKAVAADWASRGVTVNAIAPGPFLTDANRRWIGERPEFEAEVADRIPMGRWGDPREIGGLAVYLAGDASSFMTGAVLVLDGGTLLW